MERETTSYRLPLRDRLPRPWSDLLSISWLQLGIVVVVAVILGQQILHPNARIIKLVAGMLLFVAAYRARPFWALCFIVLSFPFPFSIFIGDSTMIFIVLVTLIYLARMTLGQVPRLKGTPVDAGMAVLLAAYLLSFFNIEDQIVLQRAAINFFGIVASFVLFYLTANFIRTERELKIFVRTVLAVIALSIFVGVWELFLPGRVLVPHWILANAARHAWTSGYRVGGPLYDYELFGEFMALAFFLALFGFRRASTVNSRFFTALLLPLTVFMLLTTVTRGAVLSFGVGIVYIGWRLRRSLRFRDVVLILLMGLGVYFVMDLFITNFTRSGGLLDRLLDIQFEGGIPVTRGHWPGVIDRAMDHPFVGHGPHVDLGRDAGLTGKGLDVHLWPHNQYLFYLHTVGLLGMSAYIFVVLRLTWMASKRAAASLRSNYTASLLLVLHVMMVVFVVDQVKIDYLRNPAYKYFPWILMGAVVAAMRILDEKKRDEANTPDPTEIPPPSGP